MMSEKPENRMPLSQPARAESVEPPLGAPVPAPDFVRVDSAIFDSVLLDSGFFDSGFFGAGFFGSVFLGSDGAAALRPRGVFAPAGFAGRRGVRAESPFITLLIACPGDHDGGGHPATPVAVSYAITP